MLTNNSLEFVKNHIINLLQKNNQPLAKKLIDEHNLTTFFSERYDKLLDFFERSLSSLFHITFFNVAKLYEHFGTIPEGVYDLYRVSQITAEGAKLTELPKEFGKFKYLKHLNLSHNLLTDLPQEIANLKNLKELNLSWNKFNEIPQQIGKLQLLTVLNLSYNPITCANSSIYTLTNLKKLWLNNCKIANIDFGISQLTQLEILNLDRNCLDILPSDVGNLQNLRVLAVGNNSLIELPDNIKNLKNLTDLSAFNNKLTELPYLGDLTNLKYLTAINGNNLIETPKQAKIVGDLLKTCNIR